MVEDPKALIYKVSTFKSIGWPDPFPDDVTEFDDDSEDLSHAEFDQPKVADKKIVQEEEKTVKEVEIIKAVEVSRLNYPENRLIKGQSPIQIFIPSKEIMIKLMRACICVEKVDDLWISKS